MVNKIFLLGRLTADPEVRATPAGVHVANLKLATNSYAGKDELGQKKEHTDYHNLVLFGRQAEVAGEYLRKGRMVYVDGRVQTRTWDDAEGKRHWMTEVIVETFQMVDPKPGEAA
jgi:single-strand DNA-binding protein